MKEIINKRIGNYLIKLYKHKKSSVTVIQKPYELIILMYISYDN